MHEKSFYYEIVNSVARSCMKKNNYTLFLFSFFLYLKSFNALEF